MTEPAPVNRVFVDTAFVLGLLNKSDELHSQANELLPSIVRAATVVITVPVLLEVANACAKGNRAAAYEFIKGCYLTPNVEVVPLDDVLFKRGVESYFQHSDKAWSLTDCISFLVMRDRELVDAATRDRHFAQAGFRELMH